jgi:hypothetical protein
MVRAKAVIGAVAAIVGCVVAAPLAGAVGSNTCTSTVTCRAGYESTVAPPGGFNGAGATIRVSCQYALAPSTESIHNEVGLTNTSSYDFFTAGIATGLANGTPPPGSPYNVSVPYYFWQTYSPTWGLLWHWAGTYTINDAAPIWILKDESVSGRTATIIANGTHYSGNPMSWPADDIISDVSSNSDYTFAYGSASNMFYVDLSGSSHSGWDTSGGTNPYQVALHDSNTGAYWVTWPSWMRTYKDTQPDQCAAP